MPDIDISVSGVLKLLQGLNLSKAAGQDTIKPVVLKELANEIAPIVTAIFQLSLDTGTVRPDWKQALVNPLFKKGDVQSSQLPADFHDMYSMQIHGTCNCFQFDQALQ